MKFITTGLVFNSVRVALSATAQTLFGIIKFLPRCAASLGMAFIALVACAAVPPTSAELEALRIQIEATPTQEAEARYLALFPKTFTEFTKTFAHTSTPEGLGYQELEKTSWQHLELLERLAVKHPRAVLDIWLSVSANAHYDADAVSQLQHQLAAYAAKDTKTFATEIMTKSDVERRNIVTFLADVENHSAYDDYATIIVNLEKLGQSKLMSLFLDAKTQRMKYRHAPGE